MCCEYGTGIEAGHFVTSTSKCLGDLCEYPASRLVAAYSARDTSPVDVTGACLTRAEGINADLNAFTVIDRDGALAAARASELRWMRGAALSPIDGVPITVKDIVLCHGLDVRYGSLSAPDVSALPDSPSVERLRASGAVILGVTTTPEFGWKAVTDSRRNGVSRNPWDPSKTPGGSSGGAAIAAATGAGVLHLGTDGGGSIRIPASFCGIVGHKPTFGRVPAYPASAFGTVAHIGPMARTVGDVILMLDAMSGRDLRDWTQPAAGVPPASPHPFNWKGVRIGYWNTPCVGPVDECVGARIRSALGDLASAGARIDLIALPDQDALPEMFRRHWYVGAANRLAAVDEAQRSDCDPGFLAAAALGQRYSAVELMQSQVARAQYGSRMDSLLSDYDLVLSPTVAVAPFEAGADVPAHTGYASWIDWASFSFPINLSQQPACSVPCGRTASGLPVGLQIIAARGADEKVLSAALSYEEMHPEQFLSRGAVWPSQARRLG